MNPDFGLFLDCVMDCGLVFCGYGRSGVFLDLEVGLWILEL